MPLFIGLGFLAFALSYLIVGGYILWAQRRQIIDVPNERSSHVSPTPRGGGLVIVLITLVGGWLFWSLADSSGNWPGFLLYSVGALLIANVSWLDDLHPLSN